MYNGRNALVKTFRHHGVIGYEIKVQNNQYSALKLPLRKHCYLADALLQCYYVVRQHLLIVLTNCYRCKILTGKHNEATEW